MHDEIVTELLGCALQYLVPEFAVPIYALCDSNYKLLRVPLQLLSDPELRPGAYKIDKREPKSFQTCDSNLKVSEDQI